MDFKSKDELPYSLIIFKQIININLIMSNNVLDIEQFARSVDALKVTAAHLFGNEEIDFDNERKKETKNYATVLKQYYLTMKKLGDNGFLNEWSFEGKFRKS